MTRTHNHLSTDVTNSTIASFNLEQVQWQEAFVGECMAIQHACSHPMSVLELISQMKALVPGETFAVRASDDNFVRMKSDRVYLQFSLGLPKDARSAMDPWAKGTRAVAMYGFGEAEKLRPVLEFFQAVPGPNERMIVWTYMAQGCRQEMPVYVDAPQKTPDSFYPYVEGGLKDYFRRYMESDATVLLLRGEPGTGKTNFIRNLIWERELDAIVTYEEQLYQTDEMFVQFMTNSRYNLLVMEDADTMLTTREEDGNKIMAKFLNVSDGLIRFPQKKIVISTNVIEEQKMDSALLRPGRCFDRIHFRKLDHAESVAAAQAIGRSFTGEPGREYTLAEIVNPPAPAKQSKVVGFVQPRPVARASQSGRVVV